MGVRLKRYQKAHQQGGTGEGKPPGVMPWQIWRLTDKNDELLESGLVIEEPLEIRIDGQPVAVLMRTPGEEKELAAGFVLGEGLVAALMDIALIRHCGRAVPVEASEGDLLDESRNLVDVTLMPTASKRGSGQASDSTGRSDVVQLIRSGCGRAGVDALAENLIPIHSEVKIPAERLPKLLGQITRQQLAYRAAGGIHAAAIFDTNGQCLVVCEDIGRHNAVDKATGYCLLRGISLRDKLLVSTGRASYDMVAKGVRLGVPIMASISSPTSLAVELAEALNCTLLGYLRGKSLNVYTHSQRIIA
jgi:FdhD protein